MKKDKFVVVCVFTAIYTLLTSLGAACFLGAWGAAVGASLDHANPWKAYPYFMPFCVITGYVALIALFVAIVWNIVIAHKYDMTFKAWLVEIITPIVALYPMLYIWSAVFNLLGMIF